MVNLSMPSFQHQPPTFPEQQTVAGLHGMFLVDRRLYLALDDLGFGLVIWERLGWSCRARLGQAVAVEPTAASLSRGG
jgi:hypothetical protein